MPRRTTGSGSDPVNASPVEPESETLGSTPPAPESPPPLPPVPPEAPVPPEEPDPPESDVLPLTVATWAAPGGGGGAFPLVTPQVGVV